MINPIIQDNWKVLDTLNSLETIYHLDCGMNSGCILKIKSFAFGGTQIQLNNLLHLLVPKNFTKRTAHTITSPLGMWQGFIYCNEVFQYYGYWVHSRGNLFILAELTVTDKATFDYNFESVLHIISSVKLPQPEWSYLAFDKTIIAIRNLADYHLSKMNASTLLFTNSCGYLLVHFAKNLQNESRDISEDKIRYMLGCDLGCEVMFTGYVQANGFSGLGFRIGQKENSWHYVFDMKKVFEQNQELNIFAFLKDNSLDFTKLDYVFRTNGGVLL